MRSGDDGGKTIPRFDSLEILDKYQIRHPINDFLRFLLDYNRRVNLVSRETSLNDLQSLAADCLIPFEFTRKPPGKFFDIGSGGGFPAIIVLMAFPESSGFLIERTRKKARFLAETIQTFELSGIVIDRDFIEAVEDLPGGPFNTAFMKQVRPRPKIIKKTLAALGDDGRFLYYGPAEKIDFPPPDGFSSGAYNYYLDDFKQLRSITALSKK
jgi:16S rRNA G527 N7-methylase RsmG